MDANQLLLSIVNCNSLKAYNSILFLLPLLWRTRNVWSYQLLHALNDISTEFCVLHLKFICVLTVIVNLYYFYIYESM